MISYDLAEQLRDAGWLQTTAIGDFFYDKEGKLWQKMPEHKHLDEERVAVPTLAALIAACGDDFMSLILWCEPRGDLGRWTADTRRGRGRGNTAEEAVAHAWLFLTKNQV